jgi:hypothetical protein
VSRVGEKHRYPQNRKRPIKHRKARPTGLVYNNSKTKVTMRESMAKLLGYANPYATLYTISYGKSEVNRYQYMDIFVINNGNLFKISRLVAGILRFRIQKSHFRFVAKDVLAVRTGRENMIDTNVDTINLEIAVVKKLAKKMFNNENGYNHVPMLLMQEYTAKPIEQLEAHNKKSYIVRRPTNN